MQQTLSDTQKSKKPGDIWLPLTMRIGISTGEMIVGNMGGKERFDYTVIGDAVNLGKRLETENKNYGTKIIISEKTYTQVKDFVIARELDAIKVKGKTQITRIYELVSLVNESHKHLHI